MIGAHSQVSIRPRQRSVLSKRHLVRTFYLLIPSVRDLSLPHSNRTPGSKFKCCRRRDARCSHRQLGMIGTRRRLCPCLGIFHTCWAYTCNLYIASTHFCKQKKLCHHQTPSALYTKQASQRPLSGRIYRRTSEGYMSCENRPRAKMLAQNFKYPTSIRLLKTPQSAFPVTTTLHSPDAVDSNSMFRASAHPSHAPQVPHASSRTTDSTLASRASAPRPNGRLIFGLDATPGTFRAARTPAAARTSTIGACPTVFCIRCTYVQLSLAPDRTSDV